MKSMQKGRTMSTDRKYKTAVELAREIFSEEDSSFADELEQQIQSRRLVRFLATMRNKKGVTQSDVAKVLDCQQAKISKIENGYDENIKVCEIEAYAKAVGCDVVLQFTKRNETTFDRVKRLALMIHRDLCHLASMAQNDEDIAKGVALSFGEVLFNQIGLLKMAAEKLPKDPDTDEPYINIDMGIIAEDVESFATEKNCSDVNTETALKNA